MFIVFENGHCLCHWAPQVQCQWDLRSRRLVVTVHTYVGLRGLLCDLRGDTGVLQLRCGVHMVCWFQARINGALNSERSEQCTLPVCFSIPFYGVEQGGSERLTAQMYAHETPLRTSQPQAHGHAPPPPSPPSMPDAREREAPPSPEGLVRAAAAPRRAAPRRATSRAGSGSRVSRASGHPSCGRSTCTPCASRRHRRAP